MQTRVVFGSVCIINAPILKERVEGFKKNGLRDVRPFNLLYKKFRNQDRMGGEKCGFERKIIYRRAVKASYGRFVLFESNEYSIK